MTLPFIPASLGSESFETIVSRYWRVVEGRVGDVDRELLVVVLAIRAGLTPDELDARVTAAVDAREAALGAPEAQP